MATAHTSAVTLTQRVGSALNLCYRSAVREIAKASIERRHLPEMLYAGAREFSDTTIPTSLNALLKARLPVGQISRLTINVSYRR
jgi:hypothetical protein